MRNDKASKHQKTLVESHALNRLHKVEKHQRRPYVKEKSHFSIQSFLMLMIFLIVLIVMVIGMIR